MKSFYKIIAIHIFMFSSFPMIGQTTSEDVDFITSNLIIENFGDYVTKNIGVWGLNDGNVKRSVKFEQILLSDEKRGIGIIYQEVVGHSIEVQKVYFIPEKESSDEIWNDALQLISSIQDKEEMRTLLWAVMQYASNK